MSGTFNADAIADGTLPTSQTAIYTVPGATDLYLKQLFLFNKNAADQTILVYLNIGGTARLWRRLVLALNESADLLEHGETVTLPAGAKIEAMTTTLNAVDYVITAILET